MNTKEDKKTMEWKDYIALIIAMLTTTLLPFVIFLIVLLATLIVISII